MAHVTMNQGLQCLRETSALSYSILERDFIFVFWDKQTLWEAWLPFCLSKEHSQVSFLDVWNLPQTQVGHLITKLDSPTTLLIKKKCSSLHFTL